MYAKSDFSCHFMVQIVRVKLSQRELSPHGAPKGYLDQKQRDIASNLQPSFVDHVIRNKAKLL
jgi:hypothetical protein